MKPRLHRRLLLEDLAGELDLGLPVPSSRLRDALTTAEWKAYCAALSGPEVPRGDARARLLPALESYLARLARADRLYWRAVRLRSGSASNQADAAYEHALESLTESLGSEPGLQAALDRPVDDNVSLDPEGMPRLLWSRSPYVKRASRPEKLLGIQHEALRGALDALRSSERL